MPSYGCQSPEHETDHANPNHRFTVIQSDFIIPTKPTRLGKPTEGSFYYPALREHLETFGAIRAAHDLQLQFAKGTQLLHPLDQGAQVHVIRTFFWLYFVPECRRSDLERGRPLRRLVNSKKNVRSRFFLLRKRKRVGS